MNNQEAIERLEENTCAITLYVTEAKLDEEEVENELLNIESLKMAIEALQFQDIMINNPKTAKPTPEVCKNCMDNKQDDWIPVSERLPECEQEVLICTETKIIGRNAYVDSIITPALYEDGTMPEYDSKWAWELEDSCAEWDEKEGCYIVPEGWWENRHFYCNNIAVPVDQKVIAWKPLPEPYKGGDKE